jgi:hypothetical protein
VVSVLVRFDRWAERARPRRDRRGFANSSSRRALDLPVVRRDRTWTKRRSSTRDGASRHAR